MNQSAENPVLEIFRKWNALLGENKWNLPEISDRTHQRWFNENNAPGGEEAGKVASAVWRATRPAGRASLRKNIVDVIRDFAPLAPVDSWDENTCGAWFRALAESSNEAGGLGSARIHLDAKAISEIRAEYLRWLVRECAPLRLQAIDQSASRPGKEPLRLASVYVDLNLDHHVRANFSLAEQIRWEGDGVGGENRLLEANLPETRKAEELRKESAAPRPVPALEALAEYRKFVLLGAPGSGKSTVTNFVALQLARALLDEPDALAKLGPWWQHGSLLPVRVVLRQFAAQLKGVDCGRAGHLWDFIRAEVNYDNRPDQTVECLRQIAQNFGALFLLDGLDEVRDETARRRMLEAVVEFIQIAGSRCRFLLTSRPYAWEAIADHLRRYEAAIRKGSVKEIEKFDKNQVELLQKLVATLPVAHRLAPLDEAQIKAFITHWYGAVADAHWITEAEAARKREELIAATGTQRPDLFELARNPLLLTLMATLHTNRARLPDDRADLYNEVVELLLLRWNETCGADQGLLEALQIPTLKLSDLREVIEQLAFDTHTAHSGKPGVADIPEGVLVSGLRPLLGNSADKAETALNYIENRAGLLLGQGERGLNRQYTFPHRTFQEYLAACHLANHPDFYEKAADLARENPAHWQEVLPLAARHAKAGRGVPAADVLISRQKVEDVRSSAIVDADWRSAVLAGKQLLEIGLAALESRPEHQAVRDRVTGWLARMLECGVLPATERAQAGIVLGKLGDPRPGVGLKNGVPDIEWIKIPAGKFKMGGKEDWQGGREFDCKLIKEPYQISRFPVTWQQYQAFVEDRGYADSRPLSEGGSWSPAGLEWRASENVTGTQNYEPVFQTPNHPRVGVSWFEAMAFCRWLSHKSGRDIRLPSEAEWERAARGVDGRPYPWGGPAKDESVETHLAAHCNMGNTGIGHTSAVGLFPGGDTLPLEPGNERGVADLAGNVWEWCRSPWLPYEKDYEKKVINEVEDGDAGARVLRGGSWSIHGPGNLLLSSFRFILHPGFRNCDVGFRVVCVSAAAR